MIPALAEVPPSQFPPPPAGVDSAAIDPKTGLLAQPDGDAILEYFVHGSTPKERATRKGLVEPGAFFKVDTGF